MRETEVSADELVRLRDTLLDYPGPPYRLSPSAARPAKGETVIELPTRCESPRRRNSRRRWQRLFGQRVSFSLLGHLEAAQFPPHHRKKRALLVGVELPSRDHKVPLEYSLEELERLDRNRRRAKSLEKFSQQVQRVTPATLIGRGKVEEIQVELQGLARRSGDRRRRSDARRSSAIWKPRSKFG